MTDSVHASPSPPAALGELPDTAVGAVVALVRVAELYDPAVAHRAALRAIVAERLYAEYQTRTGATLDAALPHGSMIVASAALSDVDLIISRPDDPEGANEPTRPLLGATLVGSLGGLTNIATAIEHHRERWDGTGIPSGLRGLSIPLTARITAVADAIVGNPTAGFVPSWHHARRRVSRLKGESLDPSLCDVIEHINLDDIVAPPVPSSTIAALLTKARTTPASPTPDDPTPDDPAPAVNLASLATSTTIRNAVAAAGNTSELLNVIASNTLGAVGAAEVLVLRSSSTQLVADPVARVVDGGQPALDPSRLDDLYEFSTQAELRTGVTLARDTAAAPNAADATSEIDEIIAPIMVGTEIWGALVATRRRTAHRFTPADVALLANIAVETADAIASTTHWAEMERMALRDQLTGLGNRHELYRVLDEIFLQPPTKRVDTALIMCDVDGLKIVNDTLGHHAGDRLLIDAAAALKGAVRDSERTTVCRIGGDEFCMVINGGALLTAHDISDTIERLFARSAGSGPARSISCGIAFADDTVESRSALLRAADENQYQTKRARKTVERAAIGDPDILARDAGTPDTGDRRAIRD